MRWSLLGLNIFAMAAFATPALMIFASSDALTRHPVVAWLSLASLLIGFASLSASMFKLSIGRNGLALGLMLAGLGFVAIPVCALVLAPMG